MRLFKSVTMSAVVSTIGLLSVASAAPSRQWTDASGTFSVKAELVEVKDGNVLLKKADGEVIAVPVSKLSDADRNYLSNRPAKKPAAAPPAEKPAAPADGQATGLMKLGDADGDGKISRAEWSKLAQRFREFDVDKDNALNQAELESTDAAEPLLKLADADGDGKIVRAEWAQLSQSFARLDKNKDSGLDRPELLAAEETTRARSSGVATLPSAGDGGKADAGPTVWRGRIEGRGQIELTVTGNRIVGSDGGGAQGSLGVGTFTMTGDGKSGYMDAVYTEGSHAGELCMGIYQLEGDTLRWCVSNRPGLRPFDFSPGRGNWLLILNRVNAAP